MPKRRNKPWIFCYPDTPGAGWRRPPESVGISRSVQRLVVRLQPGNHAFMERPHKVMRIEDRVQRLHFQHVLADKILHDPGQAEQ